MQTRSKAHWILFRVDGYDYALPLDVVAEVTAARAPRLIPFVPRDHAGVIVAKGEPLPAVDGGTVLRQRPGMSHRRALLLERGKLRAGLLVEEVSRIERGLADRVQEPPGGDSDAPSGADFVRWCFLGGKRLGLVDPDALLGRVGDLCAGTRSSSVQQGEEEP